MTLFIPGSFLSHSGLTLPFKIECDALSDDDLATLAKMAGARIAFQSVIGVPRGGLRFAAALEPYAVPYAPALPRLIVDDVLTTGTSITNLWRDLGRGLNVKGLVIFARGPCPFWVEAMFTLNSRFGP
ncbi:MAG TPA: hypothetical protein VNN79_24190 [Actinomycetota bacterium]|nr:hypothetical protein [Actinomycetota bacterium]